MSHRSEADPEGLSCPRPMQTQRPEPRQPDRPPRAWAQRNHSPCSHGHPGELSNPASQFTRWTEPKTVELAWPQGRRQLELGLEGQGRRRSGDKGRAEGIQAEPQGSGTEA